MTADRFTISVALMGFFLFAVAHGAAQVDHFHDKGKQPSEYTIEKQQRLRKTLPFSDKQDFEEQTRGFIDAPAYKQIMAETGIPLRAPTLKTPPGLTTTAVTGHSSCGCWAAAAIATKKTRRFGRVRYGSPRK